MFLLCRKFVFLDSDHCESYHTQANTFGRERVTISTSLASVS